MIWPTLVTLMAAAVVALFIDHLFGEPPVRWHPVVWMGHALGWAGKRVAPLAAEAPVGRDGRAFWHGTLHWLVLSAGVVLTATGLQWALYQLPVWLAAVGLGLCLKPLLAWRMLRTEVLAVEAALGESLAAGRERLSWLVSRDVASLSEAQVRESAIESLAENLSDSVVAPLFWFVLAGLPGAALYRFANTADAMWGYPGMRGGRYWQWAGKWAARADDVLSWLPARITALLLALTVRGLPLHTLARQARKTPSPNSGWPMAAMSMALGVRLTKPGVYVLNSKGRSAGPLDTRRAEKLVSMVVMALVPLAAVVHFLVVLVTGT